LSLLTVPAYASDPVILDVDNIRPKLKAFTTVVVKVRNRTDDGFEWVWFRCHGFVGTRAVVSQPGYVRNLRPKATTYTEIDLEAQGLHTVSCEFQRTQ
jgi:hypothetical protein